MARGRFINKSVTTDDKIAALIEAGGAWAGLFHHRLIAFIDINGNVRADEFWLKATIFPRESSVSPENCRNFSRHLTECGLAVPYQSGGMLFLHFHSFEKNQHNLRKDKEKPEYPEYKQEVGKVPNFLPENVGNVSDKSVGISLSVSSSLSLSSSQSFPHESAKADSVPHRNGTKPELPEPITTAVKIWNEQKAEAWDHVNDPRKIKALTTRLSAALKTDGFYLPEIIARARGSDFLNSKRFVTLLWLVSKSEKTGNLNAQDILNGRYDNQNANGNKPNRKGTPDTVREDGDDGSRSFAERTKHREDKPIPEF